MKTVESKLKRCSNCGRITVHYRNANKTGLLMFIIHLVMVLITMGIWLVIIFMLIMGNIKVGGWKCGRCYGEKP